MTVLPSPPEFGQPVPLQPTPEVLRFLALRRSTSAMTLAEPAPSAEAIETLIGLAARAPDHGKLAPWRFIVLQGEAKAAFAGELQAIAEGRSDEIAFAKLGKLTTPPLAIVVVFSPKPGKIPEWEQVLSAGAVCANLLNAALAMGYGCNWITDWYSYDADAVARLGLAPGEKVAGFMLLGTPKEAPLERERPDPRALTSHWPGRKS